jgi:hypothetical protein
VATKHQPRTRPMRAEDLHETCEESLAMEDGLRCLRCYEPVRRVDEKGLCRECAKNWPSAALPAPEPDDA